MIVRNLVNLFVAGQLPSKIEAAPVGAVVGATVGAVAAVVAVVAAGATAGAVAGGVLWDAFVSEQEEAAAAAEAAAAEKRKAAAAAEREDTEAHRVRGMEEAQRRFEREFLNTLLLSESERIQVEVVGLMPGSEYADAIRHLHRHFQKTSIPGKEAVEKAASSYEGLLHKQNLSLGLFPREEAMVLADEWRPLFQVSLAPA